MKHSLDPERVWIIGCSRCANEGIAYADSKKDAVVELLDIGWTRQGFRTYCPACNAETRS